MAFDGITTAALAKEFTDCLTGGYINKVMQPEQDEIILQIKNNNSQYYLLLSANAGLPLAHLTTQKKQSPVKAYNFCMVLRKYLTGGRILEVIQPGLERCLRFRISHRNEMGDLVEKLLIIEIMGKHSNIILCDNDHAGDEFCSRETGDGDPNGNDLTIIDSIKHIPPSVSSVREVMPGKPYFLPDTMHKLDILTMAQDKWSARFDESTIPVSKWLNTSLTGISPLIALELCERAGIDGDMTTDLLSGAQKEALYEQTRRLSLGIKNASFRPAVYKDGSRLLDYSAVPLTLYRNADITPYDSISALIENYYREKASATRILQKSADLRHIVKTAYDRAAKKYTIQLNQQKKTEDRDKYRLYGELLTAYAYEIPAGAREAVVPNYYDDNKPLTIPLDPTLTANENANRFFTRYNKLKRTAEALETQLVESKNETDHLESIQVALSIAETEDDLKEIREELVQFGYVRRHSGNKNNKKEKIKSAPLHFLSRDGFHIYVGKNNTQNEYLAHQFANGNDWWFHAKDMPGSHVIVKTEGKELPDGTFEDAARLAAHYSKGASLGKVEIDYLPVKELRKVKGGAPGFVIYHTNYSMVAEADIAGIKQI